MHQRGLNLEPAFLIHQRPYRESSMLLEIFSRDCGRLGLVARGAKRPKSPLRNVLQAFQPLMIRWSGRGELGTLTHAEARDVLGLLPGKAVLSGLYLNELIMRLTHRHDPHSDLFDAYDLTIRALHKSGPLESTLRIFEKRLLEAAGYGLVLDHDIHSGEALKSEQRYIYEPEVGPVQAAEDTPAGVSISGRTLQALAREDHLDGHCQREAKQLMRYVLGHHLGERQLQSRLLFQTIEKPYKPVI